MHLLRPQFGCDSLYYLLSSISQSLAAILALTVPLPLVFVSLSEYLPNCAQRIAASWGFRLYAGLFIVAVAYALALLSFRHVCRELTLLGLAIAAGCLAGIIPYLLWVANRTKPLNHIDDLWHEADRIARSDAHAQGERETRTALTKISETLAYIRQIATVAARNGAPAYMDHALRRLLSFWMQHETASDPWAANLGRDAFRGWIISRVSDAAAAEEAIDLLCKAIVDERWLKQIPLSVATTGAVTGLLSEIHGREDVSRSLRHKVRDAFCITGAVAAHQPDSVSGSPTEEWIAAKYVELLPDLKPDRMGKLMGVYVGGALLWFKSNYPNIDASPALERFARLVTDAWKLQHSGPATQGSA